MVKLVIAVLVILILVGYFVAQVNNLDLRETEDQVRFVQAYGNWVYKSVINIQAAVGFVVKQDWSLDEDKTEEE